MTDLVEVHTEQQRDQRSEDNLHKHIIAAMCEGSRLFFVFDRLLDTDLQPSPADFSISVGDNKRTVHACSLKDDIRSGKPWSLVSILLDQALEPGAKITLKYQPEQWFLSTADTDEPIEAFETVMTLADTSALPGIKLDLEPQAIDTALEINKLVAVGAKVEHAYDRSIKISFQQELDLTYQPTPDNFRAESKDSWLDIARVYLARGTDSKAWPELWIMLRSSILDHTEVEIAFKPSKSGLITMDGARAAAFRVQTYFAHDREEPSVSEHTGATNSSMDMHGSWIAPLPLHSVAKDKVIEGNTESIAPPFSAEENLEQKSTENSLQPEHAREAESPEESSLEIEDAAKDLNALEPTVGSASALTVTNMETPPPGQVLRTYLGSKRIPVEDDLGETLTAAASFAPLEIDLPYDEDDFEDKGSLPVKIAVGMGYFFVFSMVAVLLTVAVRIVGGMSGEAPDLLSLTFAGSDPDREPCEMDYHDGSRYSGQCIGKKRDGRGSYQWKSGDSYTGTWRDDKMDGKGVLEYRNGDIYQGSFKDNLKHGSGAMNWANGARYQGGYKQGRLHGQGTYWSADGKRFEGEFQNGATTLNGTCYLTDGSSRQGACQ